MKFLNEQGQEISLKRAESLPGYEVTLSEDVVIDSAVNNPFFKGINILQLPKKLKGFRDNSDLKMLLQPQALNSGISLELSSREYGLFVPKKELVQNKRLILVHNIFGSNEKILPLFVNFGLKKVKLATGTVIGFLMIQESKID